MKNLKKMGVIFLWTVLAVPTLSHAEVINLTCKTASVNDEREMTWTVGIDPEKKQLTVDHLIGKVETTGAAYIGNIPDPKYDAYIIVVVNRSTLRITISPKPRNINNEGNFAGSQEIGTCVRRENKI